MLDTVYSIVVTYNGIKWIEKCISRLLESDYPTHVIVVDNGSTDGTVNYISENFGSVEIIETGKNIGFGQANNIGLKQAIAGKAGYVFLLNQDAWIEKDTLAVLLKKHKENPGFAVISPIHLNGKGTKFDQNFLRYLSESVIGNFLEDALLREKPSKDLIDTSFVNAAAWLLPVAAVKKTGGFDPIFYHYGEDRNYTQRALNAGFKIGICTETFIHHDRENRVATPHSILKRDQINDLCALCNIQTAGFKGVFFRKFLRYFYFAILSAAKLDRAQFSYYLKMLTFLISIAGKVGESRKKSLKTSGIPHLSALC